MASSPDIYDVLIEELEKVDKLSQRVSITTSHQKQLQGEVEEVKEFVGFEDEAQSKNVIDKNKLPARLTPNERVRYENIGKQFTLGAGKEFQRIREKIKFSERMSTSKDNFEKGFDSIKKKVRQVKKGKGIWSKIFKVVAILGLLGYIFKEKIAKMFPESTNFLKNLVEKLKESLGHVMIGMYDYVKNLLTGGVSKILRHLARVVIPNTVKVFFGHILPEALLTTWLTVLSAFSSTASEQLEKMSGGSMKEIEDTAVGAADYALAKAKAAEGNENLDYLRYMEQQLADMRVEDTDISELNNFKDAVGELLFDRKQTEAKDNDQLKATIGGLDTIIKKFGDDSLTIQRAILTGQFDVTEFINYVGQIKSDEDALTKVIEGMSMAMNKGLTGDQVRAMVSELSRQNGGVNEGVINQISALMTELHKQQTSLRTQADTKIAAREEHDESKKTEEKIPEKPESIVIDFANIVNIGVRDELKNVFNSIDKFLKGDDSTLVKAFNAGLNQFSKHYKNFFDKSVGFLISMCKGVVSIVYSNNDDEKTTELLGDKTSGNVVVLNVDLRDGLNQGLVNSLGTISTNIQQNVQSIKNTNVTLAQILVAVANIQDLHAESKGYVDDKISSIKTKGEGGNQPVTASAIEQRVSKLEEQIGQHRMTANNKGVTHIVLAGTMS